LEGVKPTTTRRKVKKRSPNDTGGGGGGGVGLGGGGGGGGVGGFVGGGGGGTTALFIPHTELRGGNHKNLKVRASALEHIEDEKSRHSFPYTQGREKRRLSFSLGGSNTEPYSLGNGHVQKRGIFNRPSLSRWEKDWGKGK